MLRDVSDRMFTETSWPPKCGPAVLNMMLKFWSERIREHASRSTPSVVGKLTVKEVRLAGHEAPKLTGR